MTVLAEIAEKETTRARAEVTRLDNEERELLSLRYQDQISEHIYADEQTRIRRQRAAADDLLQRHRVKHETILDRVGVRAAIPRHREIDFELARKICQDLGVPPPTGTR